MSTPRLRSPDTWAGDWGNSRCPNHSCPLTVPTTAEPRGMGIHWARPPPFQVQKGVHATTAEAKARGKRVTRLRLPGLLNCSCKIRIGDLMQHSRGDPKLSLGLWGQFWNLLDSKAAVAWSNGLPTLGPSYLRLTLEVKHPDRALFRDVEERKSTGQSSLSTKDPGPTWGQITFILETNVNSVFKIRPHTRTATGTVKGCVVDAATVAPTCRDARLPLLLGTPRCPRQSSPEPSPSAPRLPGCPGDTRIEGLRSGEG